MTRLHTFSKIPGQLENKPLYIKYPLTNFTLVDHKQLHNVVIDRLRDMIIQGDLHAGEWLRQERLARELGVSLGQVYLAKHRVSVLIKKEIKKLRKKVV